MLHWKDNLIIFPTMCSMHSDVLHNITVLHGKLYQDIFLSRVLALRAVCTNMIITPWCKVQMMWSWLHSKANLIIFATSSHGPPKLERINSYDCFFLLVRAVSQMVVCWLSFSVNYLLSFGLTVAPSCVNLCKPYVVHFSIMFKYMKVNFS